jgi:hypothetical protein
MFQHYLPITELYVWLWYCFICSCKDTNYSEVLIATAASMIWPYRARIRHFAIASLFRQYLISVDLAPKSLRIVISSIWTELVSCILWLWTNLKGSSIWTIHRMVSLKTNHGPNAKTIIERNSLLWIDIHFIYLWYVLLPV